MGDFARSTDDHLAKAPQFHLSSFCLGEQSEVACIPISSAVESVEVGAAATLTRGQWFRTAEGSAAAALIVCELPKKTAPHSDKPSQQCSQANALKGTAATSLSKAVDLFGISSELVRTCQKGKDLEWCWRLHRPGVAESDWIKIPIRFHSRSRSSNNESARLLEAKPAIA